MKIILVLIEDFHFGGILKRTERHVYVQVCPRLGKIVHMLIVRTYIRAYFGKVVCTY